MYCQIYFTEIMIKYYQCASDNNITEYNNFLLKTVDEKFN